LARTPDVLVSSTATLKTPLDDEAIIHSIGKQLNDEMTVRAFLFRFRWSGVDPARVGQVASEHAAICDVGGRSSSGGQSLRRRFAV
jgi:hypothetical protein